jgi:hypothetical protein
MTLTRGGLFFNKGISGGGVYVGNGTSANNSNLVATIDRTTFQGNQAQFLGGGLDADANTTDVVTITNSAFDANSADTGGGIARHNVKLSLFQSSLTHNTAAGQLFIPGGGGGMSSGAGAGSSFVEVHDSTFSANSAASGAHGGALLNVALINLQGVTIKDNGSGIYTLSGEVTRMVDTVLQNAGGPNCDGAAPASAGGNFSTDLSCSLTGQGDRQGTALDPKLGPLTKDSFGPNITSYHMPQAGSPLIDTAVPPCSSRDQRGASRPDACDIGAVELGGRLPLAYLPMVFNQFH